MTFFTLGVETSCDETGAAVLAGERHIASSVIASQLEVHRPFGGVVPELASRRHLENMQPVLQQALEEAGISWPDLGAVAVTRGPGLKGALLVGLCTAKAIALALGIPLVGVNHLEGHIYSNFLAHQQAAYPLLVLIVSGGHTELIWVREPLDYRLVGQTRDDAAGEAFDKVARVLNLGFPGGPALEAAAFRGDSESVSFPRARFKRGQDLDFSFSGLKTAVINHVQDLAARDQEVPVHDIAASFQESLVGALVDTAMQAAVRLGAGQVALCGGVAANQRLRGLLWQEGAQRGLEVLLPPLELCMDNAAMIAAAGWQRLARGESHDLGLGAIPDLELATRSL